MTGSAISRVGVVDLLATATPLFQISFLPDLIQVNFLLPAIDVVFNLLQAPPALTAAKV
jgi:hypothetical protein